MGPAVALNSERRRDTVIQDLSRREILASESLGGLSIGAEVGQVGVGAHRRDASLRASLGLFRLCLQNWDLDPGSQSAHTCWCLSR